MRKELTRDSDLKKVILSLGNKIVRKLIWKISDNFDCDNYPSILNKFIHDCVKYKVDRAIHLSKKQNRRYIKIQYLNKTMDKIHLNRIFLKSLKNINVKLKYLENPTVVWLRTDKISSKVHNYIHIANDTKVMDWSSSSDNTCDCQNSSFCDAKLGHVVTGDLNFIDNPYLKSLLSLRVLIIVNLSILIGIVRLRKSNRRYDSIVILGH